MKLSIVVPTRNRGSRVLPTMESILNNPEGDWELIVVDQSTTDDTERALESHGLLRDPRLIYRHTATTGVSRARNEGVQCACGSIVAFTDDDCLVPGQWVAQIAQYFETRPELAVLYASVQASSEAEKGWIPEFHPLREGYVRRSSQIVRSLGLTANFAARRSALDAVGPFDELLGTGGALASGEDVDFGYRALRRGLNVYTAREPAVVHCGLREGKDISVLGSRYLQGMSALCLKQVRCGDVDMLRPVAREFWIWFAAGTANLLCGRRPSGYRAAAGILQGALGSARYGVDTQRRLYRPRTKRLGQALAHPVA